MQRTGAEAFILDLRNNPGGLVRAGLDVARIFLDGPSAVFNVTGRSGEIPAIAQVSLQFGSATLLKITNISGTSITFFCGLFVAISKPQLSNGSHCPMPEAASRMAAVMLLRLQNTAVLPNLQNSTELYLLIFTYLSQSCNQRKAF